MYTWCTLYTIALNTDYQYFNNVYMGSLLEHFSDVYNVYMVYIVLKILKKQA